MKKTSDFRKLVSKHKKPLLLGTAFFVSIVMCNDVEATNAVVDTVEKGLGTALKILTGNVAKLVIVGSALIGGGTAMKQGSPYIGGMSMAVGALYAMFIDSIVAFQFGS